MASEQKKFEERIAISFKNKGLLKQALTHRSYAYVRGLKEDNERLEFLGDSILDMVVSDYLFERYPDLNEGKLSKMKSGVVNRNTLFIWAKRIGIQDFIMLSKEEESAGGRDKNSIVANAFEALIAAIYRDQGLIAAKYFILGQISQQEELERADYKSLFQEIIQKKYKILPEYNVKTESGPDHKKLFEIEVKVKNRIYGKGVGKSKKNAEQQAAREALIKIKAIY